jgi:hypothetical protein
VQAECAAVIRAEMTMARDELETIVAENCRERAEKILPDGNISPG